MFTSKASLTRFIIHIIRFSYWVAHDFCLHSGFTRAGSIAYTMLLAFVPLTIVMVNIISFFPIFEQVLDPLENFIFLSFVPHADDAVLFYLHDFQLRAHDLSEISMIFLFITSVMTLMTLESNINEMWNVITPRRWGFSVLLHWSLMILGPLLLCASMFLTSFLHFNHWFNFPIYESLKWFPYVCSLFAFTLLYLSVPGCRVSVKAALGGGLFAAILFELAKKAFGIYTSYFPTYTLIYGTLAAIPLFLLWMYFCAFIFLLGAQVVHALQTHQSYQMLYSNIKILNFFAKLIEKAYHKL